MRIKKTIGTKSLIIITLGIALSYIVVLCWNLIWGKLDLFSNPGLNPMSL